MGRHSTLSLVAIFLVVLTTLGCQTPSGGAGDTGWESASPQDVGFAANLGDTIDVLLDEDSIGNVHSIVVVRDGKLVYERYLSGSDENNGYRIRDVSFDAGMKHDVRSITKSVVGLLYGIALSEGQVPDIDAPLVDSFPEYPDLAADEARRKITIGDTLTMSLGLAWDESGQGEANSETMMEEAPDLYRYTLEQPIAAEPGTTWIYNGGGTNLLARIIARGTGMAIDDYAKAKLFDPLGIKDFEWLTDYYGVPFAHFGLRLRPWDMAKLGQLVLDGGRWNGTQVVPEAWIAATIQPAVATDDSTCDYGYQIWLCKTADGIVVVEMSGLGGQGILVVRDPGFVMTATGGEYRGNPDHWKARWRVLEEAVLPAARTSR